MTVLPAKLEETIQSFISATDKILIGWDEIQKYSPWQHVRSQVFRRVYGGWLRDHGYVSCSYDGQNRKVVWTTKLLLTAGMLRLAREIEIRVHEKYVRKCENLRLEKQAIEIRENPITDIGENDR